MSEVSGTGGTSYTQQASSTDQANQAQLQNDFSNMSVEDIMFLVLTQRAEEQKKNIESFAASVQANTLKATNYNNLKASLDQAAKNSKGEKAGDIKVTWESEDGSTETITADTAMQRLGYSSDIGDEFSDSSKNISQNDLETLSANIANAHDKIEGDNQIAMAQLQKDMDDYQTTLQTCSSSTTSMAQLGQKIGGSVGQ